MPQLIFKNVSESDVSDFSKKHSAKLAEIIECPADWFTYECCNSTFYYNGKKTETPAIVEIRWFERPQKIKEQVADFILSTFNHCKYKEVVVFFTNLDKSSYFE